MSPCPVMKMIGMSRRSPSFFCRSSPLSPGSETSSTRQLGLVTGLLSRKSAAEANVSARHPAVPINASSDSRTETSSSTTKTTGVTFDTSPGLDGLRYGAEQNRFAERLDQTAHGTGVQHPRAFARIFIGGDEHDRDRLISTRQLALQLGARHSPHGHVPHQTTRLINPVRCQKFFP